MNKLLIEISNKQNQLLLENLLSSKYEIIQDTLAELQKLDCDLLIVDGFSLNKYRRNILQYREDCQPLFIPVLLFTSRKDIGMRSYELWKTVDEIIFSPIEKYELEARIKNLLHTRELSIELKRKSDLLLAESQKQLSIAIKSANVGLWNWNMITNEVWYSREWKTQLGYAEDEITNDFNTWKRLVHPEDGKYVLSKIQEYVKEKVNYFTIEFRMKHKNGSYLNIMNNASIYYDNEGNASRIVGSHIDITERKKTEEKARILAIAVEQSPVSILITDENGVIEYVNPQLLKSTGFSSDEVIGKNPRLFKSGKHSTEFYKNLWDTILAGQNWYGDVINMKKNGDTSWEYMIISPLTNEVGKVNHFIAIKEDISERKKMIEELIAAKEKAEEADRLKSEFLSQISHEIRTPLNAILSYSQFLRDEIKPQISENYHEIFDGIANSGYRIIRTIQLILNVSEVKTGTYKAIFSTFDFFSNIIMKVYNDLKSSAKSKGLELKINRQTENTLAYYDEYSMYQIMVNLIDNAIKYTKEGYIEIIITRNTEGLLCIVVKDTGIGMEAKFLKHMYEEFSQEETGYSRRFDGTGLGLSLVKNYCNINDITINVESQKNFGTKFTLTFNKPIE